MGKSSGSRSGTQFSYRSVPEPQFVGHSVQSLRLSGMVLFKPGAQAPGGPEYGKEGNEAGSTGSEEKTRTMGP